jgi:RNA polymerase sigma factor (sigma-70 family)
VSTPTEEDRSWFTAVFERHSPRVFAYAHRHVGLAGADDVVADTFLVAWRRRAELPDDPLPWLLVVARKTIGNRRRGQSRNERLVDAVADRALLRRDEPGTDDVVAERTETLAALAALTSREREALLLVAWDGLTPLAAAEVAGCSVRAFEVRLSRGRARLARNLARADREETAPDPPGPPPFARPVPTPTHDRSSR